MPRTDLTANFKTAMAKTSATPVLLMEFQFATGTVYVSDQPITVTDSYVGTMKSWGQIDRAMDLGIASSSIGDMSVEIINLSGGAGLSFSHILRQNTAEQTLAVLYLYFDGAGLAKADRAEIDRFYITDVEYTSTTCKLTLTNPFYRANRLIGSLLSKAAYPNMDPDAVGKPSNIIYGSVKNVLCHPVDAGAATTLSTANGITASQTTGIIASQNENDTKLPSSGVVYIDAEGINYTGMLATGELTGVTRGYGGTTATAHNFGAAVYLVKTSYIYLVADHPVKSIGSAFVDGIKQQGAHTVFTGQTGDNHPSGLYNGKAVIDFAAKPSVNKQVNVNVVDGISVNDTIAVSQGSHSHAAGTSSRRYYGSPYNLANNNTWYNNCCSVDASANLGTIVSVVVTITFRDYVINAGSAYMDFDVSGTGLPSQASYLPNTLGYQSMTRTFNTTINTWGTWSINAFANVGMFPSNGMPTAAIDQIYWDVTYTPSTSANPATGVAKSGAATKSGTVSLGSNSNSTADLVIGQAITCDTDGWQDDASGTYTGSANALIQNPADVMGHIAKVYLGLTINATFAVARALLAGYNWGGVIRTQPQAKDLIAQLGLQSRCWFFVQRGEANLIYRNLTPTTDRFLVLEQLRKDLTVRHIPVEEICNTIDLRYHPDWSRPSLGEGDYMDMTSTADATSIAKYGTREKKGQWDFYMVKDGAFATMLRDFYLAFLKDAKRRIVFGVYLDNMDLQRGDCVSMDWMLDPAFEIDMLTQWIIEKDNFTPGTKNMIDYVEITAREV